MMTWQCWQCLRYRGGVACDAFPGGIPHKILTGEFDHNDEYKGDSGRVFQPIPGNPLEKAFTDYTQVIADKDEGAYERVKQELLGLGYAETDFLEGGAFDGWSTNQLIDLARGKAQ